MFWRKKDPYDVLLPPIIKNIDILTPKEAQEYFEWFMSKIEERTAYLRNYTALKLDDSPGSLVGLWAWFLRNAEIEVTPKEQLEALRKQLEESHIPMVDTVLKGHTKQFTLETECMIRDIGMYWGEIFVKSHPSVYWSYYTKPKNDLFVNRPLLLGFPNEIFPQKKGMPFEPVHMAHVRACRLLDGEATKKDLLEIHNVWESKFL